jgi:hypothetical protein
MDGCGYRRYQSRDLAPRYVKFPVGLAGEGSLHKLVDRFSVVPTCLPRINDMHPAELSMHDMFAMIIFT